MVLPRLPLASSQPDRLRLSCSGVVEARLPRHLKHYERDREADRADEEPHDPECLHATQESEKDQQGVQLDPSADHMGPEPSIYLPDDRSSPNQPDQRFPPMPSDDQDNRGGTPHCRRANDWNERKQCRHHSPKNRRRQT